jgi:hypothetical protein
VYKKVSGRELLIGLEGHGRLRVILPYKNFMLETLIWSFSIVVFPASGITGRDLTGKTV